MLWKCIFIRKIKSNQNAQTHDHHDKRDRFMFPAPVQVGHLAPFYFLFIPPASSPVAARDAMYEKIVNQITDIWPTHRWMR
jgi:hypothetical protein